MISFKTHTLTQTQKLAQSFAGLLKKGDIVALYGTLGVGKTAFSRFVIQSLCGSSEEVPSPTFTLLQTYPAEQFDIFHFDLYRLKKADEVFELGIEDAFYDGVSLIEWPEKMGSILPVNKMLKIDILIQDDMHIFNFTSQNLTWQERLNTWNIQI